MIPLGIGKQQLYVNALADDFVNETRAASQLYAIERLRN